MTVKPSKVVVALSGGVDSSLAAALLKREGWEVEGLHFLLPAERSKKMSKVESVQRVSDHLKIPLSTIDLEEEFERCVMEPFADTYMSGLTPNPCVVCNAEIKFQQLLNFSGKRGLSYISTGHYARLIKGGGGLAELWRGKDPGKEQSYFLHRLTREQLSKTLLPLGEMTKREVRLLAKEMMLPTRDEPESQEICFLPGNDYRHFVEDKKGGNIKRRGHILNRKGEIVGEHHGTYRYTVGQRHGLGIASSRPYYVFSVLPEANQVVVGRKEELFGKDVEAHSFNWLCGSPMGEKKRVMAQIRYRNRPVPARLEVRSQERVRLTFEEPQWAIAPGQALVCYDGDRLLGGGWII